MKLPKVIGEDNRLLNVPETCQVIICGDSNVVEFAEDMGEFFGEISIGTADAPARECVVRIGRGTSANGVRIVLMDNESQVVIGERCMFSWQTEIWCTDTHAILSEDSKLINRGRSVEIGEHVWMCERALVLKNSRVAAGNVIGANTVVAGRFDEPNAVICGNPARVVRQNVFWDQRRPNAFLSPISGV